MYILGAKILYYIRLTLLYSGKYTCIPCIGHEGWQPTPDCKRGDLYTRDILITLDDI